MKERIKKSFAVLMAMALTLSSVAGVAPISSAESIEEYILKSCDKSTSDKKYIAKLMQEVEELMEEYNLFVNLIIVKVHYPGFTGLCPYICDLSDVDLCAHSYIRDIAESVIDPSTAQMFITDRLAQYVLKEDYDAIYKHNYFI